VRKRKDRKMNKTHSEAGLAKVEMPSVEIIQQELASAKTLDDFFGKEGIFARLFSQTLEQMLEAEMTGHLGYGKYEAKGRNSGNSRFVPTKQISIAELANHQLALRQNAYF
jgi:transposase-like protein